MKLLAIIALATLGVTAYWLEDINHLGRSPYYPDNKYQVFRNVKDYGAVGDGGGYRTLQPLELTDHDSHR